MLTSGIISEPCATIIDSRYIAIENNTMLSLLSVIAQRDFLQICSAILNDIIRSCYVHFMYFMLCTFMTPKMTELRPDFTQEDSLKTTLLLHFGSELWDVFFLVFFWQTWPRDIDSALCYENGVTVCRWNCYFFWRSKAIPFDVKLYFHRKFHRVHLIFPVFQAHLNKCCSIKLTTCLLSYRMAILSL